MRSCERNVIPTIKSTYPLSHFHRPGLPAGVCREKGTCARRGLLALVRKPENPIPAIPFGITKSSLRVSDGLSRPSLSLSFVDSSSGLSAGAPLFCNETHAVHEVACTYLPLNNRSHARVSCRARENARRELAAPPFPRFALTRPPEADRKPGLVDEFSRNSAIVLRSIPARRYTEGSFRLINFELVPPSRPRISNLAIVRHTLRVNH